jgi:hypothetical protein
VSSGSRNELSVPGVSLSHGGPSWPGREQPLLMPSTTSGHVEYEGVPQTNGRPQAWAARLQVTTRRLRAVQLQVERPAPRVQVSIDGEPPVEPECRRACPKFEVE